MGPTAVIRVRTAPGPGAPQSLSPTGTLARAGLWEWTPINSCSPQRNLAVLILRSECPWMKASPGPIATLNPNAAGMAQPMAIRRTTRETSTWSRLLSLLRKSVQIMPAPVGNLSGPSARNAFHNMRARIVKIARMTVWWVRTALAPILATLRRIAPPVSPGSREKIVGSAQTPVFHSPIARNV